MKIKLHRYLAKPDQTTEVSVQQDTIIKSIREEISKGSKVPLHQFHLMYKDKKLEDDQTIGFYQIEPDSTIEVNVSLGYLFEKAAAEEKLKSETQEVIREVIKEVKVPTIRNNTLAFGVFAGAVLGLGIIGVLLGTSPLWHGEALIAGTVSDLTITGSINIGVGVVLVIGTFLAANDLIFNRS